MKKLLPVISIMIAAFFAYGTMLAKDITVRTMEGVRESRLDEIFVLLGTFVVVAMVAGALVSTSTFRIVFAQRMRELALLRAIGAGRTRLARGLVLEGATTGLFASAAGVGLAWLVAQAVPVFGLKAPGFLVPHAVGVLVGSLVLTTLAVFAPAVNASKVSPLEALRTSAVQDTRATIGAVRWLLGLTLAAGAGFLLFHVISEGMAEGPRKPGLTEELLLTTVGSATLAFLALIALGPALITPVLRLVGWPFRKLGAVGDLAVSGIGGAPRRAASITTVVALGVALVIGTMVGAETLRSLAKAEMASAYPADLEITGPDVPAGLTDVLPYRRIQLTLITPQTQLNMRVSDLNMRGLRDLEDFRIDSGSVHDMGPGKILLPTKTALRMHLKAGDSVIAESEAGRVTLTVAATVFGGVPLQSSAVLDPSDLDKLGASSTPDGALANGSAQGPEVESLVAKRVEKEGYFFSLFAVAIGLMMLTMLISIVGVGSTTALSVLERTRESGLLRAVGLSRPGLRAMVTAEAALYGTIGAALGLGLGIPYAWLAVVSLGIEWPMKIPYLDVVLVVLSLAALTALAGLLPARRAARVSPVAALRD